jgi:hypothetical protein
VTANRREILRDLFERVASRGVRLAKGYLQGHKGSQSIQDVISYVVDGIDLSGIHGRITVPQYWAVYYHEGRGPVHARAGGLLCFFPDRKDDPRLQGLTGLSRARPRRLTKTEFYGFLAENDFLRAADLPPVMIVTESVGPAKGVPFFTQGLRTLPVVASLAMPIGFSLALGRAGVLGRKSQSVQASLG